MRAAFQNRWWVVFASVCGLLVGTGSVHVFAFGVFLKPVTQSLGIGREIFSFGLLISSVLTALGCLPLGWALDRWGVRRVLMVGIVLYALGEASFSLLSPSAGAIYLVFTVAGIFGCMGTPIPFGAVLSMWFDRQRGLAIGIAMAGVGLGVVLIPKIAGFLIGRFDWRIAYLGMAATILLLAWLPVALFVREPTAHDSAKHVDIAAADSLLPGVSVGEAIRSWRFWALTIGFFIAIIGINGTLTHIVALLTDRGVPQDQAIGALQAAGVALIAGRILAGWTLDRFFGPYVAIGFFIVPMIGIALLATNVTPLLGASLCGIGVGAEVDLMAFMVSRYFGLKSYGRIYGVMFAVFALAQGFGATIAGASYDRYHSYTPAFLLFEAALVVTCFLLAPLGPYPFPARAQKVPASRKQEVPA